MIISFIKRKNLSKPTWPYVKQGYETLCRHNCNKAFVINGNESFTWLWGNNDAALIHRTALIWPHWRFFIHELRV